MATCVDGIEPSPELCRVCSVGDSCVIGTDNGVTPWWEKTKQGDAV